MPYIWRCQISYNGSGTFLINSAGQPVVPGTTITTTAFNALTADLASGLTTAMTKDGQTVPTANIPMGGFKLTGLGAGTSATDAAQFGQLQNAPVATLITVSGADTITGTLVQTLTAYATGQQFSFVAAGTNTTAVTLNIDGLGAKAVTRTGAVALAAGALVSGQMAIVEYDGTRFQLINANAFTNLTVSGALTVGTTLAVTGVATLTAQPILSSLTASLPVFTDASKGLVSNTMTGTGSVMMSASPTTTGTLTAAAINASGLVAMAAAATIGTTLAVTGTTTAAAINATTFTTSGRVSLGNASNSTASGPTLKIDGSGSGSDQIAIYEASADKWHINSSTGVLGLYNIATSSYAATISAANVFAIPGTTSVGVAANTTSLGGTYSLLTVGAASGSGIVMGQTDLTATNSTAAQFLGKTTGASGYQILGGMLVQTDGTSSTNAVGRLLFYTATGGSLTERMRINSTGALGLAVTPQTWNSDYAPMQLGPYGTIVGRVGNNELDIFCNVYRDAAGAFRYLNNGFAAAYAQVNGENNFYSAASGTAGNVATLNSVLTISTAGAVTIPGTLGVSTGAAVGGATPGAGGLAFPATAVAVADANTLDDYEEGTWTPVLGGATSESGQSYATNSGSYTKIGNQVFCTMRITLTTAGTITGNAVIKGLPFQTSTSSTDYAGVSFAYIDTVGTAVVSVNGLAQQNRTSLDIYYRTAASTTQTTAGNTFWVNGTIVDASIVYHST